MNAITQIVTVFEGDFRNNLRIPQSLESVYAELHSVDNMRFSIFASLFILQHSIMKVSGDYNLSHLSKLASVPVSDCRSFTEHGSRPDMQSRFSRSPSILTA